jgi:GDP-L-fucose synthase
MSKRKILICGATGFIGRNIAESFAENPDYEVVGVYNRRPPYACAGLSWIKADLTNPADIERAIRGVDIIVQAAATTSGSKDIVTRPYIHVTDNAVMNSLLFRAAHDHGVKHVVFFSCTVMYPSSEKALNEDDFDANRGIHPRYFGVGWMKVYIEKHALHGHPPLEHLRAARQVRSRAQPCLRRDGHKGAVGDGRQDHRLGDG